MASDIITEAILKIEVKFIVKLRYRCWRGTIQEVDLGGKDFKFCRVKYATVLRRFAFLVTVIECLHPICHWTHLRSRMTI